MIKHRAYETLERLAFERVTGSEKEREAAQLLMDECKKMNVEVHTESYTIPAPEVTEVSFEVLEPEHQVIYCTGIGKSGETPEEGLTAELVYIHDGEEEDIQDVKGKIVLSTNGMKADLRKKLVEKGALGYVTSWGGYYDDEIMQEQVPHRFARLEKDDTSNFPGVMMNLNTIKKLLHSHPKKVKMVLRQDANKTLESQNVVATIKGSEKPEEVVLFSAHYDSVEFSSGAWDNGSGDVTILEICHYFAENPPKRTVKFVWCGSEEIGLLGSKAYCEQHKDELENIILNVNFDMTGCLMAKNFVFGSCDQSIIDRVVFSGKIKGIHFGSKLGLMPSDSTSFALNGVPAMSFGTMTPRGGAEIHSRRDSMDNMDADELDKICEFVCGFADEIVNAVINVVPRELPKECEQQKEEMMKSLGFEVEKKEK